MKKTISILLVLVLALSMVACAKTQDTNSITFTLRVVNGDSVQEQKVTTTETSAGKALLEQKLIDGEQGDYGLYIKTVLGTTVDYNTDGAWWALYINGESSMVGVDSVTLVPGMVVEFRVEKA